MKRLIISLIALCLSLPVLAEDILNIRTNPFMVLGSTFVNLELDVRTTDHWATGAFVQVSTDEPLFETGIRVTYFESGTFLKGWMTGLELFYSHVEEDDLYFDVGTDSFCRWDDTEVCGLKADKRMGLRVDHGYLWRWGTFNTGVGVGAAVQTDPSDLANWAVVPALYFSVGWIR